MSDGINAWRRLEEPYMNYVNQFISQNPNFKPLEYYSGSTVADLTPQAQQGLDAMQNAGRQMQGIGNNIGNFGMTQQNMGSPQNLMDMLGRQTRASDGASTMARNYGRQGVGVGNNAQAQLMNLSGSNINNAESRANQMMNFGRQGLGATMDYAGQAAGAAGRQGSLNQQGLNQNSFGSILANDSLQGEIDRVSQDIMRNTSENVIPGLATSAVGAGNPYGTRTQHSYDTAMRDTREAIGDVAAELRFNNFNAARDATLAQQQQNQQTELARRGLAQQGALGAGGLAQGAYGQAIGAAQGAGQLQQNAYGMGMNAAQQGANTQLQALAQMQNAAIQGGQLEQSGAQFSANMINQMGQQGVQNQLAAAGMYQGGAGQLMGAGQYHQNHAQAQLDDQVARHMFNQTSPFYTLPLYTNAMAPPAGMPFRIGQGGGMSGGPNMGFF